MPKREGIKVPAKIIKVFPSCVFQVELDSGLKAIVHLSGKMRMHSINVALGDVVTVELSPYDPSKGRIIFRQK